MAALIAACDRSGVAQRVFAARHGMTPGAFAWWRHALGVRRGRPRRPGPAFVEVTPQAAARATAPTGSRAAAYVVRLPSGTWVRIPAQFEAAPLEILLGVLRRTC
jgi:hypothetical protein